jgi:hypothetical protein
MCVLIFCTRFARNILIIRRTERFMIENVYCSSCKVPVILNQILMKIKFSRQLFEKYTDVKFHENPSSGSRVLWGTNSTDRHEEAGSSFSYFCENF